MHWYEPQSGSINIWLSSVNMTIDVRPVQWRSLHSIGYVPLLLRRREAEFSMHPSWHVFHLDIPAAIMIIRTQIRQFNPLEPASISPVCTKITVESLFNVLLTYLNCNYEVLKAYTSPHLWVIWSLPPADSCTKCRHCCRQTWTPHHKAVCDRVDKA